MQAFAVVLQGKEEGKKNEFFTPQNEIVPQPKQTNQLPIWFDFDEAQFAAKRARLQDTQNRVVRVMDVG